MSTAAISTVVKMMSELPEPVQEQVVDRLREYLLELQDELERERLVQRTRPQLRAAARRAKEEIAAGKSSPMDYDRL
jgi:hypothetical protein